MKLYNQASIHITGLPEFRREGRVVGASSEVIPKTSILYSRANYLICLLQ